MGNRRKQQHEIIQVGSSRFVREQELPGGRKAYRVEADVLQYFGLTPKPGATFVHQVGLCSSGESWEQIEARNVYPAGIYGRRYRPGDGPYVR